MNILLGVHQFFPENYAGTERYVLNLARQFQAWGHAVHVLTYDFKQEATQPGPAGRLHVKEYRYQGIPVTAFSHPSFPDFGFDLHNEDFYRETRAFLRAHPFDIYHCAHPLRIGGSLRAAYEMKIPTVLTLTDYWLMCPVGILLRSDNTQCDGPDGGRKCRRYCFSAKTQADMDQRLEQAQEFVRHADCLLSPSLFLIGVFEYNDFVPRGAIRLSRHGFDYSDVPTEPPRETDPERITVGYIGTVQYHKGVHVLVRAFRKVRSSRLRLQVWGGCFHETEYDAHVKRLAADDHRIEFRGPYEHADLARVTRGIDIVVVPSLWYENAPLTVTSAHAFRIPVIAADMGGMAEMVRPGYDGLTFRPGDVDSLAERLETIARQPELIGQFGRNVVPPPRIEEEAFRTERLYRAVLARRTEPQVEAARV